MTKLYLAAIVKNEAHIIRRMLESAKPYISGYLICDTGSTDGTQDVIREVLADLPGEVIDRPWQGFGHNKSEMLEFGRQRFGPKWYALTFDADEQLVASKGFKFPKLHNPAYHINFKLGEFVWSRVALMSNESTWRYEGVLHEAPVSENMEVPELIDGVVILSHGDGARSGKDLILKYTEDAELLERAMQTDPTNTRNQFYLAQSYRDSQQYDKAIRAYQHRAEMGGWPEEVYWSLLEIARIYVRLNMGFEITKKAYLKAWKYRKQRIEAAVELAMLCRVNNRADMSMIVLKQVLDNEIPDDILFVTPDWWKWRRFDEYAVCAGVTGDIPTAIEYGQRVLEQPLPENERERVVNNVGFWKSQLYNKVTA